ncbi:unnamed protein product, partial [Ixodes hexagonus]
PRLVAWLWLFALVLPDVQTAPKTSAVGERRSASSSRRLLGGSSLRSFFDAEDVLLFMLGLGLASLLGLATFMAPFTSILASGLAPVAIGGPGAATVTNGRKRRSRDDRWADALARAYRKFG